MKSLRSKKTMDALDSDQTLLRGGEGRARREAEELWVERGHLVSGDTLREGPPGERSHLREPHERSHLAGGATWREEPWAWRQFKF